MKKKLPKPVNFEATRQDRALIAKISERAEKELGVDLLSTDMDITATHLNGNPLRLSTLLTFSTGDFGHDILGIARFLDRNTGTLTGYFSPRCSSPVKAAKA